jgi:hypothetical protein
MMAPNFYDKKLFVQALGDQFECPICLNIMKDPVQCPRGHTFCRHCISKHLEVQAKRCPTCREVMTKDRLVPSRIIESLIENSEVHCVTYQSTHEDAILVKHANQKSRKPKMVITVNPNPTCEWSGKLIDAVKHHKQCPFARIWCPHSGCEEGIVRKDLPEHIKCCLYRLVPCKWCSLSATTGLMATHLPACTKRPVLCPNGCLNENGELLSLLFDDVPLHRKTCSLEEVDCKFATTGCDVRCSRNDMCWHERDAGAHIGCLLEAY